MDEIEASISLPPLNLMVPMIKCCFYSTINDWDSFNATFDIATQSIEQLGMGMMNHGIFMMKGEYFENLDYIGSQLPSLLIFLWVHSQ